MASIPLPQTFEVGAAERMAAAEVRGDSGQAERVRRHLVAESATSATEAATFDHLTRASLLVRQMVAATEAGDQAKADRFRSEFNNSFDGEIRSIVVGGMLLQVGCQQGWLPNEDYDQLLKLTDGVAGDVKELVVKIRRGKPG